MKRKKRRNFLKAGALVLGALASNAFGANWFVDDSAPTSGQTGANWTHPFVTIQQAVSNPSLVAGDEIHVAQGTYKPSSQSTSIELAHQVSIQGGYAGYGAMPDPDARDVATYITTLSGDLGGGTHAYHVVKAGSIAGPPSGATPEDKANLDGFTITGGAATGTGTNQNIGAGIFIDTGNPRIRNCILTENTATVGGGGIYCLDTATAPEIRKCKITSNNVTETAEDTGGGGIGGNASVKVINTLFQDNRAEFEGGAVNIDDAEDGVEITLINCQFVTNSADRLGGGVYVDAVGLLTMTNCLFNADVVDGSDSNGGGIWTASITLDMTNCTVVHCRAEDGNGGGLAAYPSLVTAGTIANCIFFDNYAGIDNPDIEDSALDNLTVSYCVMQELPVGQGTYYNNLVFGENGVPSDPQFVDNSQVDPALNDYHLTCGSERLINGGNNSDVDADADNTDEDSSTSEGTPALEYNLNSGDRIIGHTITAPDPTVDLGAFELSIQYPCGSPPTGDCSPLPCTDGVVNVDDLLMVITSWGACPSGQSFCPGDVAPYYGAVNIDDLLVVINDWSQHCVFETYDAGSLNSVEDCIDAASLEYEPYTQNWYDAIDKCVEALCIAEIIDCD